MAQPRDSRFEELECCLTLSRRDLLRTLGAGVLAGSVPLIGRTATAAAGQAKVGPSPSELAETAVARFHASLSKAQREQICFPFDHPLRSVVKNNWEIVKPSISDLNKEQQALCHEIMKGLCSEDGLERFTKQMEDDAGGFEQYHVAVVEIVAAYAVGLDVDTVGAVEVFDDAAVLRGDDLAVVATDESTFNLQVVRGGTADDQATHGQ